MTSNILRTFPKSFSTKHVYVPLDELFVLNICNDSFLERNMTLVKLSDESY